MDERSKEISERIINWFSTRLIYPYECRINITNNCNLACLPCISRGRPIHKPKEELSKEKWLEIIEEAAKLKVKRFDICGGGEPFMRTEVVIAVMEKIKNLGLMGTISTNGTLFTRKLIEKIVRIEWDEIRVSIDGPDERTDDYIRGVKGSFKKSIEAIKTFVYFKKKLNQKKPSIIIMPVLTSLIIDKLCEFVELARSLSIDALILQPFMSETPPDPQGVSQEIRKKISQKLKIKEKETEKLQECLRRATKLAEKYNLQTNLNFIGKEEVTQTTDNLISLESRKYKENPILKIPCYVPWWLINIDANGRVNFCSNVDSEDSCKEKKLRDIWLSRKFKKFRETLAKGHIPKVCRNCCIVSLMDNRKIRETIFQVLNRKNY
jgi:MoaA/NifB/PqqE/SkfB family radical SAM enzyme